MRSRRPKAWHRRKKAEAVRDRIASSLLPVSVARLLRCATVYVNNIDLSAHVKGITVEYSHGPRI